MNAWLDGATCEGKEQQLLCRRSCWSWMSCMHEACSHMLDVVGFTCGLGCLPRQQI